MPNPAPDYYNRLLEQRRAEYASKGLSKMPPDFLVATSNYLAGLRELLEKEVRENPTSRKVELTRVTYQRALASARDVLEARLTKIAQQSAQHVNLGGEPANLLPEEKALYDAMTRELGSFRRNQAPFLEGSAPMTTSPSLPPSLAASAPPAPSPSTPHPPTPRATSPPTTQAAPPVPAEPSPAPSTTTTPPPVVVRILENMNRLALPKNETLELLKEDLVTLPPETSNLLVHSRKAERVDVRPAAHVT